MESHGHTTSAQFAAVVTLLACILLLTLGISNPPRTLVRLHLPAEFREVSASITCGAVPESSDEFLALRKTGIRTILSVDGMQPDVEAANATGLRYVHIPIGYDGVPEDDVGRMTRVLRDCDSPIYVHCHHGKHRGPAAAAVCAMIAEEIDMPQAIELLTDAGTSHDYSGLWRDVRNFKPLTDKSTLPPISSSVELEPLAATMVHLDECWEQTQRAVEASKTEQALEQVNILEQLFREASRLDGVDEESVWLLEMLDAESVVASLRDDLTDHPEKVTRSLAAVAECCRNCHQQHRN